MSTAARLLRSSKPADRTVFSSISSSYSAPPGANRSVRCAIGISGENRASASVGERKSTAAVKASVGISQRLMITKPAIDRGNDLVSWIVNLYDSIIKLLRFKPWRLHVQTFIERVIIDCRFFTLFAVAGSLIGSVLCFIEGCFLVLATYFKYFQSMSSHKSDSEHMVQLLIEAMGMFSIGTAMLIFGIGIYAMFVGTNPSLPRSNLFGLFQLKSTPKWVQMDCVSQAKSKIGYAIMMILQVGNVEKFSNVPVVTCLDLACFAGAVLISSACLFVLSRLSAGSLKIGSLKFE